jgi:hypothetical protein
MNLRKQIEAEAKSTIGYSEAENKESFMTGVGVAISKLEQHYEQEIKNLKNQAFSYKNAYFSGDLKTLASIIKKYTED